MKFSLVVTTINRPNILDELLASLASQNFKIFEVIIIDQSQTGSNDSIISKFNKLIQINHVKITQRGASLARNEGIKYAKGEIITFPDDDCLYHPNVLSEASDFFDRHLDCSVLSVNTKDKNGKGSVARLSNKSGIIKKYSILRNGVEFGMFFRKEVFRDIKFNPDFGPGAQTGWWCDEGADLLNQIINDGFRCYYKHDIVIYHPNPKLDFSAAQTRSYHYGLARGKFLKLHNYSFFYVIYVWLLYLAGSLIGLISLNLSQFKFYYKGLIGRIKGYLI